MAARVLAIRRSSRRDSRRFPAPRRPGRSTAPKSTSAFRSTRSAPISSALMTIAIGGTFSIKRLTGIRVVDMKLPEAFRGAYPGPKFGIDGSRRLTGVEDRPIIGTHRQAGARAAAARDGGDGAASWSSPGVDFIKDDEKLMSPAYSPLAERVKAVMPLILDHEQKTGKKVMYAFGISHADPDEMMRNHDLVVEAGGNCRGGQHQLRSASAAWPSCASAPDLVHPRPPQRLGHPDPASRPRHGLQGLAAVLAPARRRPVPDQRHRRQILGAGRILRRILQGGDDADLLAGATARCRSPVPANGAARRRRPSGGPAARST